MSDLGNHKLWLALRLTPGLNRARFYALMNRFPGPGAVYGASAAEIARVKGFSAGLAADILRSARTDAADRELEAMARRDVRLITRDDTDYPENLHKSALQPPLLYVCGTLTPNDRYSVSMVGSRQATQYGRAVARTLSERLARFGITVVSGFARGIDSVSHEASIAAGGRTLAVLGNGHDVCYPAENAQLRQRIAANGALLSEYPMATPPDRFNFPERNHLIAAISLGTVIAEAAQKSGSLITARLALEENRFVFSVPGDITRNNSLGANSLIQQGARLVQRAEDILVEMQHVLRGYLNEELLNPPDELPDGGPKAKSKARGSDKETPDSAPAPQPASPKNPLAADEQFLVDLISHEPQNFDQLAPQAAERGIAVQKLSVLLMQLELRGVIRQLPGRLYMMVR